jgi:HPt (histidine-containing phosphotransfer) domain-containing protein
LLPEQFDSSDIKNLTITAHGIKAAAANVGENEVSETAKRIEIAAKEGDTNTVSNVLPKLIESLKMILKNAENNANEEIIVKEKLTDTELIKLLESTAKSCAEYDESGAVKIVEKIREFSLTDDILKCLKTLKLFCSTPNLKKLLMKLTDS